MSEQPPDQATAALPSAQQRLVGGRYRLLELCGRGGTAEVWRGLDEALGRVVAVKVVTVPTDEGARRAGEEARLLARLSHPSLVPVYDAGTDTDDRPWVVMELVQGETLGDTIRRGPLDPVRTASVGAAVADALGYVHAQGLVHRDIKPANVLVGDDGRVRLTDFGIARLVDAAKVTATGMTVGTASYLSPEQVLGERVTPAADVYALGLVLLECLTGRREYTGAAVEVALARLNRPPAVPPDLPYGWSGLLAAMTARDPAVRPTSAEVAQELRRIAGGGQATTALLTPAVDRTQVLQQTRVAPAPPTAVAVPPRAARPAPRPARPAPAATGGSGWRWALALVAVIALLAAVLGLSGVLAERVRELPPVSTEVPLELRQDLERLQDAVEQVEQ